VDIKLTVDLVHAARVPENQADEDKDGTLLGEPETEGITADVYAVECIAEQNAGTEGNDEPDNECDDE
jgi:hypothetical protein